jgi:hypothetical protein
MMRTQGQAEAIEDFTVNELAGASTACSRYPGYTQLNPKRLRKKNILKAFSTPLPNWKRFIHQTNWNIRFPYAYR